MKLYSVAEQQSAVFLPHRKDIMAKFQLGKELAVDDRYDYAFSHLIIFFAALQRRIHQSASIEQRAALIKAERICLHFDV